MILGHATDVFAENGGQEQDLIEKARDLLIPFEAALSVITSTLFSIPPATDTLNLSQAYAAYVDCFCRLEIKRRFCAD